MISANRSRFERVLGHIIQNAIEATPKDGQVWVRLKKMGKEAIIEIQDTGQGMSEQFIKERLFKPFESTKSAGMGIGVFESREYVQELGGRLDVTSTESIGTTFHIILQLQENQ
jgi:signal transduction histidine kinase